MNMVALYNAFSYALISLMMIIYKLLSVLQLISVTIIIMHAFLNQLLKLPYVTKFCKITLMGSFCMLNISSEKQPKIKHIYDSNKSLQML